MAEIDRTTLQRLRREERLQLVEVLGRNECEQAHLPGALHIGLPTLHERAPRDPDCGSPVVVYCDNFL
jgi:rhodanese-related sulfurtransferase